MAIEVLFASVPVADLRKAIPWYEALFGRSADIVPNQNELMWRMTGNGWIYVIGDTKRAGGTVVTIAVNDLEQLVTDLADRGISPGQIVAVGDAGRRADVVDPDGNVLSWIQVTNSH